ncbi:MAG: YbgC/FadM family acyl-CoA thioesterase [Sandaracinaceae bacterium]|jgi:acyl-CoA thioester hydrolase|nr:YbgC/FadM family acyl-CoA thioesterase [Sandaracinaceae bacterium]MBP7681399.1 YbgC/FadM family acyl-CoA thioesterase [Deltaproteobacteria bacterium]MBK6807828.1 YbgC/FadM family acyl-CoA thioesterase [Sandaracinaceae bacterium]MBK7772860.1 YbgC/FadM family acyl-CoA thioesterase [Sandaracinaceae bacterium]MBK8407069.1 YbgC/FadM family acyl-CoA thioesterase [Sandaracinaceae bacterium]
MSATDTAAPAPHIYRLRTGYGDTDQSGVIHHAVYMRYLEDARADYLRARGLNFADLEQRQRIGMAVARATMRFLRPARFDDLLDIEVRVETQRATMLFDYRVLCGDTLLLEAQLTLACIDIDKMRAIRLPPEVAAACRP